MGVSISVLEQTHEARHVALVMGLWWVSEGKTWEKPWGLFKQNISNNGLNKGEDTMGG